MNKNHGKDGKFSPGKNSGKGGNTSNQNPKTIQKAKDSAAKESFKEHQKKQK